jgi:hypothetical protein
MSSVNLVIHWVVKLQCTHLEHHIMLIRLQCGTLEVCLLFVLIFPHVPIDQRIHNFTHEMSLILVVFSIFSPHCKLVPMIDIFVCFLNIIFLWMFLKVMIMPFVLYLGTAKGPQAKLVRWSE